MTMVELNVVEAPVSDELAGFFVGVGIGLAIVGIAIAC